MSLTQQGGGTLTVVRMGLGWDAVKRTGLFGRSNDQALDVDASTMLIDRSRRLLDQVA